MNEPALWLRNVSKWYGDIVAVSGVSFAVDTGVTGLLGPNGAGKSTLLKMMAGLLKPSSGGVHIAALPPRGKPEVYRHFGMVHESENVYPYLSGREYVALNARLQSVTDVTAATEAALATVEMTAAGDRKVGGYSKGMRQRIKVAGALVHNPEVLLMDEPLSGMDPAQRAHMIELIRDLGTTKTVVVSSHVLAEVERFAGNILVIVNGKLAAAGDFRVIREKMDQHDHTINLRISDARRLAAALIGHPAARAIRVAGDYDLTLETGDVRALMAALPVLARDTGVHLYEVVPVNESLQSVFSYLVQR